MMREEGQNSAVIIAPDYCTIPGRGDNDMRQLIHTYLVDAGMIQKCVPSAQIHVPRLKRCFQNLYVNTTCLVDAGDTSLSNVLKEIKHAALEAQNKKGVLFLYFCGHSIKEGFNLRGVEVLRWEDIDAALRSVDFTGVLVQILNTRSSTQPEPASSNEPPCEVERVSMPYKVVRISAAWSGDRSGNGLGNSFATFVESGSIEKTHPHNWNANGMFDVTVDPRIGSEFRAL